MRRIHQLLGDFGPTDTPSLHALALQTQLREIGYESEIFASRIERGAPPGLLDPRDFRPADGDLTLYHYRSGSGGMARRFRHALGRRGLVYYGGGARDELEASTRPRVDFAWAVSSLHQAELRELGFAGSRVVPLAVDFSAHEAAGPDYHLLREFRADGWVGFLSAGRLVRSRRAEEVVRVFAWYHRFISRRSRLYLVGEIDAGYRAELADIARSLDVEDQVVISGRVSLRERIAFHRLAHVWLTLNEREDDGFPLMEAMHFGLPIIAYKGGVAPEVLGDAGVLVRELDIPLIAEVAEALIRERRLRARVLAGQRDRLRWFLPAQGRKRLRQLLAECAEGNE